MARVIAVGRASHDKYPQDQQRKTQPNEYHKQELVK